MEICAIGRENECLLEDEVKYLIDVLNEKFKLTLKDLNSILEITECDDTMCAIDKILDALKKTKYEAFVRHIRFIAFKLKGPKLETALLDNFLLFRLCDQIALNYSKNDRLLNFAGVFTYDFNVPPETTEWAFPLYVYQSWQEEKWSDTYFIFNTDHREGYGIHWVSLCISISNGEIQYFDSYGNMPKSGVIKGTSNKELFQVYMLEWINAIILEFSKHGICLKFKYNNIEHQEKTDSSNCGVYCCYFIHSLASGKSFNEMVNSKLSKEFITDYRKKIYVPSFDYSIIL
jgi:hypothetical protein